MIEIISVYTIGIQNQDHFYIQDLVQFLGQVYLRSRTIFHGLTLDRDSLYKNEKNPLSQKV